MILFDILLIFRSRQFPKIKLVHKIGVVKKQKHLSMAYTLGNKCAKNCCKRTILVQLIAEDVVTCFFLEHSVYTSPRQQPASYLLNG